MSAPDRPGRNRRRPPLAGLLGPRRPPGTGPAPADAEPDQEPESPPEPTTEQDPPAPQGAGSHTGGADDQGDGISRRTAIGILGASAVAAALGIAVVRRDAGPEPALVQPGIPGEGEGGSNTGSTGGIAAIGEAYLAAEPAEADRASLFAALGIAPDAVGDPNAQLDALAGEIHLDFEEGRTVRLGGWLLSLTEARLAALVALPD